MALHWGRIYYCFIMLLLLLQALFWRRFRAIILLSVTFSSLLSQFVLLFASASISILSNWNSHLLNPLTASAVLISDGCSNNEAKMTSLT